jgi:uncharacterized protein involved in exopolysaccharide biosynthesis
MLKNQDTDINITLIISIIKTRLSLILITTMVFFTIFLIIGLQTPNTYQSNALISIKDSDDSAGMSSMMSQYGGLASLAGISLPSGSKDKLNKAIAVLNSKNFFNHINDKYELDIDIFAMKSFDVIKNKPTYKKNIYDKSQKKWVRNVKPPMKSKPSDLELHKYFLKNIFSVSKNPETDFISISVVHPSPEFSKKLLEIILSELNLVVKEKDLEESNLALEYLNNELPKTKISEVRKSINQLIEVQLKTNMMASIQKDYVFDVIDPPFVPEKKISPNRLLLVIFGVLVGLFTSIFYILFSEIYKNRYIQQ